jgi:hypothetical protein
MEHPSAPHSGERMNLFQATGFAPARDNRQELFVENFLELVLASARHRE